MGDEHRYEISMVKDVVLHALAKPDKGFFHRERERGRNHDIAALSTTIAGATGPEPGPGAVGAVDGIIELARIRGSNRSSKEK